MSNITTASGSTITYIGDGSRKYYRVFVLRDLEVRQWGRIGTSGQFKTIRHGGVRAAEDSAEQQLRRKVAKGYGSRRDLAFSVDAERIMRLSDQSAAKALAAAYEAAEAHDELDDLLEMRPAGNGETTTETMQHLADRALSVVTLAATSSEDAAVQYAALRADAERIKEQWERAESFMDTIEIMLGAHS